MWCLRCTTTVMLVESLRFDGSLNEHQVSLMMWWWWRRHRGRDRWHFRNIIATRAINDTLNSKTLKMVWSFGPGGGCTSLSPASISFFSLFGFKLLYFWRIYLHFRLSATKWTVFVSSTATFIDPTPVNDSHFCAYRDDSRPPWIQPGGGNRWMMRSVQFSSPSFFFFFFVFRFSNWQMKFIFGMRTRTSSSTGSQSTSGGHFVVICSVSIQFSKFMALTSLFDDNDGWWQISFR